MQSGYLGCADPAYNPTAAAAFSLNRFPSRMYLRSTVIDLWPVVRAITRSSRAGAVRRPASASGYPSRCFQGERTPEASREAA
jgi:hypothetical protein